MKFLTNWSDHFYEIRIMEFYIDLQVFDARLWTSIDGRIKAVRRKIPRIPYKIFNTYFHIGLLLENIEC